MNRLLFLCVLPLVLITSAIAQRANDFPAHAEDTCPFPALLSENVQSYEKAYAQEMLKQLRTKPTFSDDFHIITTRELVKPMYDYMLTNRWPTAITTALSNFMVAPSANLAACFPELATAQEALQQWFEQQATATEQYRKDAEQGSAFAQTKLGDIYFRGQGVPQDYQQALVWYRKAADQGVAEAQYNLGYMYRHGLGLPQDYQQALTWYRKAADQGWAQAQTELGFMYFNGQGVPKDYKQAVAYYRKAADQGVAAAQHSLGVAQQAEQAERDRARGYESITVETFVLDGRDLASKAAKVSLSAVYVREGKLEVLYADTRAVMMAQERLYQPNVPLLTDDASRDFRQYLLRCQSNPGSAQMGCPVTVLGRATMCTLSNAFGGTRAQPCVTVEDGRQ